MRFSGYVRTADVKRWSGLWMRIDRKNGQPESFDNMNDRRIVGTTDWTQYTITLDVQPDATTLNYGVLQEGLGSTWVDDLKVEVVAQDVRTTGLGGPGGLLAKPANLDFEAPPVATASN